MNQDIAPWLILKNLDGVGNILIKRLINRFGSPEVIFSASKTELCSVEGITLNKFNEIKKAKLSKEITNEINTASKENIKIIDLKHKDYPSLLKEIPDPPPVLYVRGDLPQDIVSIAIVGSRKASYTGRASASKISNSLSKAGIRITSGMALGIDGAAHNAALNNIGGTTAVLGSGLLNIYPREHKILYNKIIENGAVVSEFPLFAKPSAFNFPARNRIISGLSIGVIVVEAAEKSGALITANIAAEQGKDVFTIKTLKDISPGIEKLNNLGTKEIEGINDILKEYPWMEKNYKNNDFQKKSLDLNEKDVVKALEYSKAPLHIDELRNQCTDIDTGKLSSILMNLELKGIINQLPGKFYYLIEDEN